jgi:hypothetical protein
MVQLVQPGPPDRLVLLVWMETDTIHTQPQLFRLTHHQVMVLAYHLRLTIHLHTYPGTPSLSWILLMIIIGLKDMLVRTIRQLVQLQFIALQTSMVYLVHLLQSCIM